MAGAGGLHGLAASAYVERFVHLCMHANTLRMGQKSKPCVHCTYEPLTQVMRQDET
jgi:hypothetical protein